MPAHSKTSHQPDDSPSSAPSPLRGIAGLSERLLSKIPGMGTASDAALAGLFHKLSTMLSSGLRIDQAIQTAMPITPGPFRTALKTALERIRRGEELGESLRGSAAMPPLVVELITAAENAGALAEVCGFLAKHYEVRVSMRRRLLLRLAWPVTQLVLAVFVIALLIFILGIIGELTGNDAVDILGLGLVGAQGAVIFLLCVAAVPIGGWLVYRVILGFLGGKIAVQRLLLQLPALGSLLMNSALARFSWAFHLTSESGTPVDRGLALSLRATNNPAFVSVVDRVHEGIQQGNEVTETLSATGLFPAEFLELAAVGETSGTLPETMQRLSGIYQERAERSLNTVLWIVTGTVWFGVAAIIILAIFRIFSFYLNILNSVSGGSFLSWDGSSSQLHDAG